MELTPNRVPVLMNRWSALIFVALVGGVPTGCDFVANADPYALEANTFVTYNERGSVLDSRGLTGTVVEVPVDADRGVTEFMLRLTGLDEPRGSIYLMDRDMLTASPGATLQPTAASFQVDGYIYRRDSGTITIVENRAMIRGRFEITGTTYRVSVPFPDSQSSASIAGSFAFERRTQ